MLKGHPVLPEIKSQTPTISDNVVHGKKNLKLMEINYRRNQESDYTEKIEHLYKTFDYSHNSNYYWGIPELSVLYGSPLYQEASESQKKALNHLFWTVNYYGIAGTEKNTIFYNQITASAFFPYKDYEVLCHTLDVETNQERYHINAFHTIGNATEKALYGDIIFGFSQSIQADKIDRVFHKGLAGRAAPRPIMDLFTISLSKSPFLASQYYTGRGIGNLHLKNKEITFVQYHKELEKNGEFIPAPTSVARYHLLDEAFHTTTSQLISHDIYKDFPKPTAYENFMANMMVYMLQRNVMNSSSVAFPGTFAGNGIPLIYKLLQTPLFGMSDFEALEMMSKCYCQEHEGFHVSAKYYKRLHADLCKFVEPLEYLWPVNRELRLMESGSSLGKAIANNIQSFNRFSQSIYRN